jgi:SpoVK/Ycf46/Vps4 family AAA+-type ATPase
MVSYEKINPIYHRKIEVIHLATIFKRHLELLGWKNPIITNSYLRSSSNLPELESKKAIKVEHHDLDNSFSTLARFTDKGDLSGYDFKVGIYVDYDVAYLIGRDYVGDDLTLFAAKSDTSLKDFDKAVKKLYKDLAQKQNAGKLTIYTIEHGQAKTHHVPMAQVTSMDMICDPAMLNEITSDLSTFFESDEVFKHFDISHRRGILLHGPPGTGKTLMAKYIATIAKVPVVQFFASAGCDTGDLIRFFEYMSDISPAIVILEDLDSLFKGDLSRSNFLNIVDGACTDKNLSLLILATTNHIKDIDEAITQRPSRFDRHYFFDYPNENLRREYILNRFKKLDSLVNDKVVVDTFVKHTEKMSFAHLNEIYTQACLKAIGKNKRELSLEFVKESIENVKKETTNKKSQVGMAPLAAFDKDKGDYI